MDQGVFKWRQYLLQVGEELEPQQHLLEAGALAEHQLAHQQKVGPGHQDEALLPHLVAEDHQPHLAVVGRQHHLQVVVGVAPQLHLGAEALQAAQAEVVAKWKSNQPKKL